MKSYVTFRPDLADAAAVIAYVAAVPNAYNPGTLITALDGALCHVTVAGTAVTVTVT